MDMSKQIRYAYAYAPLLAIFVAGVSIGKYTTKMSTRTILSQTVKDPKWEVMHERGDYTEMYRTSVPTGWLFVVRQDGQLLNTVIVSDPEHKWL